MGKKNHYNDYDPTFLQLLHFYNFNHFLRLKDFLKKIWEVKLLKLY